MPNAHRHSNGPAGTRRPSEGVGGVGRCQHTAVSICSLASIQHYCTSHAICAPARPPSSAHTHKPRTCVYTYRPYRLSSDATRPSMLNPRHGPYAYICVAHSRRGLVLCWCIADAVGEECLHADLHIHIIRRDIRKIFAEIVLPQRRASPRCSPRSRALVDSFHPGGRGRLKSEDAAPRT